LGYIIRIAISDNDFGDKLMKQSYLTLVILLILNSNMYSSTQLGSDIDGEAAGDYSGQSAVLSTDGSIVAIGARFNDGGGDNSGHVRVYQYSSSSWSQLGSDIDGEAAGDYSGGAGMVSLSSDGSKVAIGAYGNDGNGSFAGHVRVYEYSSGSWSQLGSDIDGEAANDWSGVSVSLSSDGTIVAIGANANDGNGDGSGHVRVYQYSSGSWSQLGGDIDGEAAGDQSGISVSLSSDGTIVAIGAEGNDDNGSLAGQVRIYQYSSGSWSQLGGDIDGEAAGDQMGRTVSLSSDGSIIAIGAFNNDGNGSGSGHARIYQYGSGSWSQLGSDIDGEAAGDNFGSSVSLSSNGSKVAIGANNNDGNGSNAGHVRVYEYSSGSWTQLGSDIDGEAAGDNFGFAVNLSPNGSRVSCGAFLNDGNGENSGHVRVYTIEGDQSLPVELTSFSVINIRDNAVTLQWVTESEVENLGFIIERRQDDTGWSQIASYMNYPELLGQGSVSTRTEYNFIDESVISGVLYDYRLADVSYKGAKIYHSQTVTGVEIELLPELFLLGPAYPNPFNPATTISYSLPKHSPVNLTVFDVQGRKVTTLLNEVKSPGQYEVLWNGLDQAGSQANTGVYFARLEAGSYSQTIKMVYLR
jgi:hypothetical protein